MKHLLVLLIVGVIWFPIYGPFPADDPGSHSHNEECNVGMWGFCDVTLPSARSSNSEDPMIYINMDGSMTGPALGLLDWPSW